MKCITQYDTQLFTRTLIEKSRISEIGRFLQTNPFDSKPHSKLSFTYRSLNFCKLILKV